VGRKFFNLIRGDAVHVGPKRKSIPAAEFSQLVTASEILLLVDEDVEKYKIEIANECEILKAQARQEGFEEGFKSWAETVAKQEVEIKNVRSEMQKILAPVAIKAAKKIVNKELETSEDTIADIVINSLKSVSHHKRITIYVNKKDLRALETHKPRLKEFFEELETLTVSEREDVAPGGCIIETEGGIINAQLENQWRILEKAFDRLLKS